MRTMFTVPTLDPTCDLTYNIASGLLKGMIDGTSISCYAGSGGRAGSKTPSALNTWLANNPFATNVKLPADKSYPGGPLPMGKYRLTPHESKTNILRLTPVDPSLMFGRSGMLIHGRGPRGSDGCIVPTDFANVTLLYNLAQKRKDSARPDITLFVMATGTDLNPYPGFRGGFPS